MRNTGTWDSDLLFIFAACFFSPVVLFFLLGIFLKIKDLLETCHAPSVVYIPVEKEVIRVNNVYHYPKKDKVTPVKRKSYSKPKPKASSVPKKKRSNGAKVQAEAIDCLIHLGYSKSQAKAKVLNACRLKSYKTAEDIVLDLCSFKG